MTPATDSWGQPEIRLLLTYARRQLAGTDQPLPAAPELSWAKLLWTAYRHGLLPLLSTGLTGDPWLDPPAEVAAQLEAHLRWTSERNQAARAELARLAEAFARADLPWLPLRCSLLLSPPDGFEPEPEPLDVCPIADMDEALRVLAGLGYQPVHRLSAASAAALRRTRGAVLLRSELDPCLRVEVHQRSAPIYYRVGLDPKSLWERRRPLPAQGAPASPSAEDLALVLALRGGLRFWDRLCWLVELAHALSVAPPDYGLLLQRARETRLERPALLALALAHRLLAAPTPEHVLAQAEAQAPVPDLAMLVERRLALDSVYPMTELERARFRLRLQDHFQDRVRYCLSFALEPDLDEVQALSVPAALRPLYHALRPVHLFLRATAQLRRAHTRAPFVPSPLPVVERMLAIAGLRAGDVLYDLGCGDGRILVEAAARYGVRCVGVDIDAELIARARARVQAAGVDGLVTLLHADAFAVDVSAATVLSLWTVPDLHRQLAAKLRAQLSPGARIVSHSFDLGGWPPDQTELVHTAEGVWPVYLWRIPGRSGPASKEGD